ncbi:MAG TPA: UbiA family prenyltransferase, partial [Myxococcales bacterium]
MSEAVAPRPSFGVWLMAARPRTLSAAISPVLVGTAVARHAGGMRPLPALLALLSALFIQVGTNFANDYSDFRHGADAERVGPTRVTQSGLVQPATVKVAAFVAFGISGLLGLWLTALAGWPILAIGIASVAA